MKKHRKPMLVMFCLLAGFLLCGKLSLNTMAAASDASYQSIFLYSDNKIGPKVKVGKYYLWVERGKDGAPKCLKAAKSKSSKGTTIASSSEESYIDPYCMVSNGEKVYYLRYDGKAGFIRSHSLVQVDIATKKSTVLKKSSSITCIFYWGTKKYAYGKYVYYKDDKNGGAIIQLDTKTKKTKVIVSNIGYTSGIILGKERYMYIEIIKKSQSKILVYDCKTGKLSTVHKKNALLDIYCYKNKVYIAETSSSGDGFDTSSCTVYTYNMSGSGKKVFMKSTKVLNAPFFNDNYCYYDTPNDSYKRVNLKNKKVQTISKKVYESKKYM